MAVLLVREAWVTVPRPCRAGDHCGDIKEVQQSLPAGGLAVPVDARLFGPCSVAQDRSETSELGQERVDVCRAEPIGRVRGRKPVRDRFAFGPELDEPRVHDGGVGTGFDDGETVAN
jgi:hypothetical protein